MADALVRWGAGPVLLRAAGRGGERDLVARALLFRLLTDSLLWRQQGIWVEPTWVPPCAPPPLQAEGQDSQ